MQKCLHGIKFVYDENNTTHRW